MESENGRQEDAQVGHNYTLAIVLVLLILILCLWFGKLLSFQMLPDRLHSLKVTVAAFVNETQINHKVDHSDLANARCWLDLKLLLRNLEIIFKSPHEEFARAIARLHG